jgi:hypothetical protein
MVAEQALGNPKDTRRHGRSDRLGLEPAVESRARRPAFDARGTITLGAATPRRDTNRLARPKRTSLALRFADRWTWDFWLMCGRQWAGSMIVDGRPGFIKAFRDPVRLGLVGAIAWIADVDAPLPH